MGRVISGSIWRGWAALCLLAGTVVVPLFWEIFSGGTVLRFLALPIRYAWAWWIARPILKEGWLQPRDVGVGLALFATLLSAGTLIDLFGLRLLHPGWFLTLEWWQRGLYPYLALLPQGFLMDRPSYLWIAAVWNLIEGVAVGVLLWPAKREGASRSESG